LATSAVLAIDDGACRGKPRRALAAILAGYAEALAGKGRFFVLEENHPPLRRIAYRAEHEPRHWWSELNRDLHSAWPPGEVAGMLLADWPSGELTDLGFYYRSAGRARSAALRRARRWRGAFAAREAKAIVPSAAAWALGRQNAASRLPDAPACCSMPPD
jgi:hypothetical protein